MKRISRKFRALEILAAVMAVLLMPATGQAVDHAFIERFDEFKAAHPNHQRCLLPGYFAASDHPMNVFMARFEEFRSTSPNYSNGPLPGFYAESAYTTSYGEIAKGLEAKLGRRIAPLSLRSPLGFIRDKICSGGSGRQRGWPDRCSARRALPPRQDGLPCACGRPSSAGPDGYRHRSQLGTVQGRAAYVRA